VKKHRIFLSTVLLVLTLGTVASQFAQDTSSSPRSTTREVNSLQGIMEIKEDLFNQGAAIVGRSPADFAQ
jgi:hypothetical protein